MEENLLTIPNVIITICGVLAPVIVQLVTKYVKNEALRYVIAGGLSALTGIVAMWILKIPIGVVSVSAFVTLASAAYKLIWKVLIAKSNNGSALAKLKAEPTTY